MGNGSMTPEKLIESREATHGSFHAKAGLIQGMKSYLRSMPNWKTLLPEQREALDMIVSKIGRIMTGNPDEPDHWNDIAGYAILAKGDKS